MLSGLGKQPAKRRSRGRGPARFECTGLGAICETQAGGECAGGIVRRWNRVGAESSGVESCGVESCGGGQAGGAAELIVSRRESVNGPRGMGSSIMAVVGP